MRGDISEAFQFSVGPEKFVSLATERRIRFSKLLRPFLHALLQFFIESRDLFLRSLALGDVVDTGQPDPFAVQCDFAEPNLDINDLAALFAMLASLSFAEPVRWTSESGFERVTRLKRTHVQDAHPEKFVAAIAVMLRPRPR